MKVPARVRGRLLRVREKVGVELVILLSSVEWKHVAIHNPDYIGFVLSHVTRQIWLKLHCHVIWPARLIERSKYLEERPLHPPWQPYHSPVWCANIPIRQQWGQIRPHK